jgi:lycopene cyclase domain-containing protein
MNKHYTYLLVDFFCLLFPLLFSFHPRLQFHKQIRFAILPMLSSAFLFLLWDSAFTKMGIWGFNPDYLTGIYIGNLPVEEILFFLCIPYACVFTHYCISLFLKEKTLPNALFHLALLLGVLLMLSGLYFIGKLYTSATFMLCGIFLLFLWWRKEKFLPPFFISFLLILIPFFISNGILTGSFLDEPVVWYNDEENLGIRMATIPFEDTFYGMALLLMNVAGFEWNRSKAT